MSRAGRRNPDKYARDVAAIVADAERAPMRANIPESAARRPWCWRRRIPIPFVTLIPPDGSPVKFSIEDRARIAECGRKKLCQLCGKPLDPLIYFLGGEMATRIAIFRQAPFHEACARYSVATCPYLRSTDDPQFATVCRRFEFRDASFPLTSGTGVPTIMKAFMARAIVRVEPVASWAK